MTKVTVAAERVMRPRGEVRRRGTSQSARVTSPGLGGDGKGPGKDELGEASEREGGKEVLLSGLRTQAPERLSEGSKASARGYHRGTRGGAVGSVLEP